MLSVADINWGERERAPHSRVCREFSLYLYISGVRRAVNNFWPLFCGFLRHSLIQKTFTNCSRAQSVEDANQVYLLEGDNKGGNRPFMDLPIISMARAIGATVWQGSIYQCESLATWTDLSNGHSV